MANRVAWLTKRVKIGGQWFVRKPIIKTSGFVTEKVVHDGHSLHAPGTFVLEWYEAGKRQRKPLTANAQVELIGMEAFEGSHFLGRALREQVTRCG